MRLHDLVAMVGRMKLALALISLIGSVFVWWVKQDAEDKAKKAERKKEIKDAVFSGDVSRIHAVIDGLRRKAH